MPVDHRRRNKSEESLKLNADRIKAYRERIIVLPRRNKKNNGKVGSARCRRRAAWRLRASADETRLTLQVPDLTNVSSTRDVAAAFPIPAGIVAEAPRAITAEEKEASAFRTLRVARAAHRNEGMRAARQKKKEEEAKDAKK